MKRNAPARHRLVVAWAIIAIGTASCRNPAPAAWVIEPADGTKVIELPGVDSTTRVGNEIRLHVDLTIGDQSNDDYRFYNAIDLDVDAAGRIYVLDQGNRRIQVFARNGTFLQTIGRQGAGPGEIGPGGRIAIVGDHLVRVGDSRITVWSLDGKLVSDHSLAFAQFMVPLGGDDRGNLVGSHATTNDSGDPVHVVVRVSDDGQSPHVIAQLPQAATTYLSHASGLVNTFFPKADATFAMSRAGIVIVTTGDEYQLHAFDASGTPLWALRVAAAAPPTSAREIETSLKLVRAIVPEAKASQVAWPSRVPALSPQPTRHGVRPVQVDGKGFVYVFPYDFDADHGATLRPVDVYTSTGERIFSGYMTNRNWRRARGEYLYGIEEDSRAEQRIVRFSVARPF